MRTRIALILSAVLLLVGRYGAAAGIVVVAGNSKASVVLPTRTAVRSHTFRGAVDLVEYVKKITSRSLPLVDEGRGTYEKTGTRWRVVRRSAVKATGTEIHVGWTRRALKDVGAGVFQGKDMDAFLIRVTPGVIYLVGKNDWGTSYACTEFLETYGKVRWYMPSEFGEDVPQQEGLAVPEVDAIHEPAFQHRQYSYLCGGWRRGKEMGDWLRRNRVRARLYYHHNLFKVFEPVKYAKKYPDVYPILGGHRRIPGSGNSGGWQPCLTHPKAVDITMEYARSFFKKQPHAASISLGVNDGGGFCECKRCLKAMDKTAEKGGSYSRMYFKYANAVARRFDKELPDKQIGFLWYGKVALPPKGLRAHPRLVGFVMAQTYLPITAAGKKLLMDNLMRTSVVMPRFAIYDWFYGAQVYVPRLQIRQAKWVMETAHRLGARHLKAEAYPNWGLDSFKYWMHTRLMWDPTRNIDAMMDEFFPRFFREAAKPMRQYFRIVAQYTAKAVIRKRPDGTEYAVNFRFRKPEQFESFPPEAAAECEPFLEKAAKLAQSYMVQDRVRYFRNGFSISKHMTLQYHHGKKALELLARPAGLSAGMAEMVRALAHVREIQSIYRFGLSGDRYCVASPFDTKMPNAGIFEKPMRARIALAGALSRQLVDALGTDAKEVYSALSVGRQVRATFRKALSDVTDRGSRDFAASRVLPLVGKVAICNRTAAPALDGKLDDACWGASAVYAGFVKGDFVKPSDYSTEVRVVHDGTRMYVGFLCRQDTSKLLTWTRNRDGRVWREGGVEFHVNKATDTKATQRFQAIFNTRGNIFDYYAGSAKWNADIRVATQVHPDHYVIEFSVPLRAIDIDPAKTRFVRVNFMRNVYAREKLGGGNPKEVSAWYPTAAGNLDPQARGWLVFNN